MEPKNLSALTDQELLKEAKKRKSSAIIHALIIGFMVGVIVYSVAKNTWGLLTLIPLYFVYTLARNRSDNGELEQLLKERGLKP